MIDTVRWCTVAASIVVVVIGTPQWGRWWREFPPVVVQGRLALAALNVVVGYGTAEALVRGLPGGPRSILAAVAMLWTLYTVAWQPVADLTAGLRRTLCRRSPTWLTTPPRPLRPRSSRRFAPRPPLPRPRRG